MKLVPVTHANSSVAAKNIRLRCCHCECMFPAGELMANVMGRPFHSYYCQECAIIVPVDNDSAVQEQADNTY